MIVHSGDYIMVKEIMVINDDKLLGLPSGNHTCWEIPYQWRVSVGKPMENQSDLVTQTINGVFLWKVIYKWWIFHCCV